MRICASSRRYATTTIASLIFVLAALAGSANDLNSIKLKVGGQELTLSVPAVYDGHEVYLPLDALRAFGASGRVNARGDKARVTFADGNAADIEVAQPTGVPMLPLTPLNTYLNAEIDQHRGVCEMYARVLWADVAGGKVRIATSFPAPTEMRQAGDRRNPEYRLDFIGAALPINFVDPVFDREPRIRGLKVERIRGGVRVTVVPAPGVAALGPQMLGARTYLVRLDGSPLQGASNPQPDRRVVRTTPQPVRNPDPAEEPVHLPAPRLSAPSASSAGHAVGEGLVRVTGLKFDALDANHVRLKVETAGRANASARLVGEPAHLVIDVPGSVLDMEQHEWEVSHPLVREIHAGAGEKPGTTRITLDLSRVVAYHALPPGGDGFYVNLSSPRGAGRRLDNVIIVVDPGHGGPADGCSAMVEGHKVFEKNITLSVGNKLRALLREAGTNVIMTRSGDQDVSLADRPDIANHNNADLFVSIHVDDCTIPNTGSGTTAYYHGDDASSRALAHAIVESIGQVSGLPCRGVRSDKVLYHTGLAVLRRCTVPAVLVEMGYINNDKDRRKLVDEEFHQAVAEAIFEGIRSYVEGGVALGHTSHTITR